MNIRISLGSAISLDLKKGSQSVPPTTLYIMLGENCVNNCAFCTQAIENTSSRDHLSRVIWPEFRWEDVLGPLRKGEHDFRRACFQTLSYNGMLDELVEAIGDLKDLGLPISAAVGPLEEGELIRLKDAGLDRVGIALDAANDNLFENIKGSLVGNPYSWEDHLRSLERATKVFPGRTTTHLIVGLGETDEDLLDMMIWCRERGITVGLFAYTPFPGVRGGDRPPELARYRAIQATRAFIFDREASRDSFCFKKGRLTRIPDLYGLSNGCDMDEVCGQGFETSGCADCNRPFYNETVSGPRYNHPRELTEGELTEAIDMVVDYLDGRSQKGGDLNVKTCFAHSKARMR
ncbi:MAG: radical SAM protein [Thermoplasmata archaeon]|nr:radical SAM protein [Thermoplasmata archaeon]